MTDVVRELLWYEKYRPSDLPSMALAPDTRAVLTEYLVAQEIPHLLFVGPSGAGKTTAARILSRTLDAAVLTLNASSERGIDTVRELVRNFAQSLLEHRWNIVFLDEADALTADAQTALRNLIEAYADRTRFLLTANFGHKIIGPIQSRCQLLLFDPPPLKERYRILEEVLRQEGITSTPGITLSWAERFSDMRRMLTNAQRAVLASGNGALPLAPKLDTAGSELLTALLAKNWTALRRATTTSGFDAQMALREMFWTVADDHPQAGRLRHLLGRGVHETGYTPDPVVLFLAVMAEVMEGL